MRPKVYKTINDLGKMIEDFSQYEPMSGCLLWTRGGSAAGYGQIRANGKTIYAHRISFLYHNGFIDEKKHVLHKCDTPQCVNPLHLYLGNDKDNVRDMYARGRVKQRISFHGELNKASKLKEKDVMVIKRMLSSGKKARDIAKKFNVTESNIHYIKKGETWKSTLTN